MRYGMQSGLGGCCVQICDVVSAIFHSLLGLGHVASFRDMLTWCCPFWWFPLPPLVCPWHSVEGGDGIYQLMSSCLRVARLAAAGAVTGCSVSTEVCCQSPGDAQFNVRVLIHVCSCTAAIPFHISQGAFHPPHPCARAPIACLPVGVVHGHERRQPVVNITIRGTSCLLSAKHALCCSGWASHRVSSHRCRPDTCCTAHQGVPSVVCGLEGALQPVQRPHCFLRQLHPQCVPPCCAHTRPLFALVACACVWGRHGMCSCTGDVAAAARVSQGLQGPFLIHATPSSSRVALYRCYTGSRHFFRFARGAGALFAICIHPPC